MNMCVFMGRLGKEPTLSTIQMADGERPVANFPLVVRRNNSSDAFLIWVNAYGSNAEFVEKYLKKGTKIMVYGELVISAKKDEQSDHKTYFTQLIMGKIEFASAKGSEEEISDNFVLAGDDLPFEEVDQLVADAPFK